MTNPDRIVHRVGGLDVTAQSLVLQRRNLHPDADRTALPRFGDSRWDLSAGNPDRHSNNTTLNWNNYPQTLRQASKLYVFALINVIDGAPRFARVRSEIPSMKTIRLDQDFFRMFVNWLADRGIARFAEVTTTDMDDYYRHITDQETARSAWKASALTAVRRLHAYRNFLPEQDRLPEPAPWGGASSSALADHTISSGENRTPRIDPIVMETLLSAALLVIDTIADDLVPTARTLIARRHLAHRIAPDIRRQKVDAVSRWSATLQHLECLLPALAAAGHPLPGVRVENTTAVDLVGLAVSGWLDHGLLATRAKMRRTIEDSGLPVEANLLRVERFSQINGRPWRDRPVDARELLRLLRHITTAGFLAITYLSGVRTGEALNLRRGCITRDAKLGLIFMSGQQMKAGDDRRERSPATVPWVVTGPVAQAVAVLEDLAVGSMLFPRGDICSQDWFLHASSRPITTLTINAEITEFISWFNTDIVPAIDHPPINDDPRGKIVASRLRRTLAWHIVRRPGGTIAGATQYGHLHTQIVHGYAGRADSGFRDDIAFEEFLLRAETLHADHQRLRNGEHVSGPAADTYRARVANSGQFVGLTITTRAQVDTLMANPDLEIHHGAMLTCVYRPETAACRTDDGTDNEPAWHRCRLTCRNAARTDRDIENLRQHVCDLATDLQLPGLPGPARQRIQARLSEHQRALDEHQSSRTHPTAGQGQQQ